MNLFVTDECPYKAAYNLPDKLVVKMALENAQMLGAHLTLEKPFSGLELILAIDKVLGTQAKG